MTKEENQQNKAANDKIVAEAKRLHYLSLHNETSKMVKELAKDRLFHEVEDALHVYGTYLERHPEALEVLQAS